MKFETGTILAGETDLSPTMGLGETEFLVITLSKFWTIRLLLCS
jgi:hypothetical protein